eukprot:TRINITY_DN6106_c0_g1_i2.p1 TRINITY_DN6106_c0_g1~~TRINITY_DN6106_c0_g1_i2.p1  ORF type:complete len:793 (+),score=202.13 TRINITY_DN6106_c0_g1_i2:63-2441(+)
MFPLRNLIFVGLLCFALQWSSVSSISRQLDLGVCWYPEQWPESLWEDDLSRMAALGIKYARIAEFSWSVLEPSPGGTFQWDWLDRVLSLMDKYGVKAVIGTPTATPPKWLIDKYGPESILPVGRDGQYRKFGSRRHYSFSSFAYRNETARIVTALAQRYGNHSAVAGWQVDNEFGCHDTVRTYDKNALSKFRVWLAAKYNNDIASLNAVWGNTFWSMNYGSFQEIDLPNLSVTEANPSHWLDFYRFASSEVVSYHTDQVSILRKFSPGRFITTNFMGFFFEFDSFALAENTLDFAAWDSYPLGFTDTSLGLGDLFSDSEKVQYYRTGHPDLASFHHSLYRGMGKYGEKNGFWIMEQQPGPVNWASHNPSPAPGMIRLWSLEAFAHGAAVVSYFRWRQAAAAQEQMHSGLNRRDNLPDVGFTEVQQVTTDLKALRDFQPTHTQPALPQVAMIFDFESQWVLEIEPQGAEYSYVTLAYRMYSALRGLSLDVHVVSPAQASQNPQLLSSFSLIVLPSQPIVSSPLALALANFTGPIIIAPRTGAKTSTFQVPDSLPPSQSLQDILLPIKISRVESLRPGFNEPVSFNNAAFQAAVWREWIEDFTQQSAPAWKVTKVAMFTSDNRPAVVKSTAKNGKGPLVYYMAFFPSLDFLTSLFTSVCQQASIPTFALAPTLRLTSHSGLIFAFNYGSQPADITKFVASNGKYVLGSGVVQPYSVSAWDVFQHPPADHDNSDSPLRGWWIALVVIVILSLCSAFFLLRNKCAALCSDDDNKNSDRYRMMTQQNNDSQNANINH